MTTGSPLMRNAFMSLAKNILLAFGLSADAAIQKKIFGSATIAFQIKKWKMEIVKLFEESGLQEKTGDKMKIIRNNKWKEITETIKNETKEQKKTRSI